ncbi:hypothetical protein ACJMK2_020956 [Sinanodonta woodiana]|uniref:Voltage-gated hydrogen channel 1 n=1 Tax=Sinanodonta woodiana TaxID=1069815 RepID=A0ABD3U456_SINWO
MFSKKVCILKFKCMCRLSCLCKCEHQTTLTMLPAESSTAKPLPSLQVLADKTIRLTQQDQAFHNLSKTEKEIEKDLEIENRDPPNSTIGRYRHRGRRVLHSKQVLLMIVVLNVVDCLLVLGELMLDIHYMKDLVEESRTTTDNFFKAMQRKYPSVIPESDSMSMFYKKVVQANCTWKQAPGWIENSGGNSLNNLHSKKYHGNKTSFQSKNISKDSIHPLYIVNSWNTFKENLNFPHRARDKRLTADTKESEFEAHDKNFVQNDNTKLGSTDSTLNEEKIEWDETYIENDYSKFENSHTTLFSKQIFQTVEDSTEQDVAGALHKASTIILGVLFLEAILKIICMGPLIVRHKFEFFDSIIVICSFVLDLVFIKGLTSYHIEDFVFILTFLLPWRVIRVANSLLVSVRDHEHFHVKLIYKQKKTAITQLRQNKIKETALENYIEKLEKILESEGISQWKIQRLKAVFMRAGCPKFNVLGSFASLALGSVMDGLEALGRSEHDNNNDTKDLFLSSPITKSDTIGCFESPPRRKSVASLPTPTSVRMTEFLLPKRDQFKSSPPPRRATLETTFSFTSESEENKSLTDHEKSSAGMALKPRITVSEA